VRAARARVARARVARARVARARSRLNLAITHNFMGVEARLTRPRPEGPPRASAGR
jgi:hypothetical protein